MSVNALKADNLKYLLLSFFFCFNLLSANAQQYHTLRGYVYSQDQQALPGASIRVFDLQTGTVSNQDGQYELKLESGLHRISVSYMGYAAETIELVIDADKVYNFLLNPDQQLLDEIVVKNRKKDKSYEIIRKVIEHKDVYFKQYENLASGVYIKAQEKWQNKAPKDTDDHPKNPIDITEQRNYFEAQIDRFLAKPDKIKEVRNGVKKIGQISNLFYTSTTDNSPDLYQNLQVIKKLGANALLSPFSTLGLLSYKFKLLGSYYSNGRLIYQIAVKPADLANALYEGEVEVIDGIWFINKVNLTVPKKLLIEYNSFKFEQQYAERQNKWVLASELYQYTHKEGGVLYNGQTDVSHSNFRFDSTYSKGFFNNELGRTAAEAYKKDSTFWEQIRPQALNKDEQLFLKNKQLEEIRLNSKEYLDSIDAVYNKITFPKLAWTGVGHINRSKKTDWNFGSIPSLFNPLAIGGFRMQYFLGYYKRFENRKQLSINPYLNYGFLNRDLLGSFSINYFYNPIKQSSVYLRAGSNFDVINGSATIGDLARRNNFFISRGINLGHRTELFNGFYFNTNIQFTQREDLRNFQFSKLGDQLFQNNTPAFFPISRIGKFTLRMDYTPGQEFLSEPNEKVVLGSKYPTLSWRLTQAYQLQAKPGRTFTYTEFNISQQFNIGLLGASKYRLAIGKFLDTTSLAPMDYQYQRGGDRWWMSPSMYTYQLIPSTFSTFNWFFESHYEHQFNGFFTSKVPLLNKTGIREVGGAGFLYVPEMKYQYSELYAGANRVFSLGKTRFRLGAYYVLSQSNRDGLKSGFKFSIEPYNREKNTWSF